MGFNGLTSKHSFVVDDTSYILIKCMSRIKQHFVVFSSASGYSIKDTNGECVHLLQIGLGLGFSHEQNVLLFFSVLYFFLHTLALLIKRMFLYGHSYSKSMHTLNKTY